MTPKKRTIVVDSSTELWKSARGNIPICDMNDGHVLNSFRWLSRSAGSRETGSISATHIKMYNLLRRECILRALMDEDDYPVIEYGEDGGVPIGSVDDLLDELEEERMAWQGGNASPRRDNDSCPFGYN